MICSIFVVGKISTAWCQPAKRTLSSRRQFSFGFRMVPETLPGDEAAVNVQLSGDKSRTSPWSSRFRYHCRNESEMRLLTSMPSVCVTPQSLRTWSKPMRRRASAKSSSDVYVDFIYLEREKRRRYPEAPAPWL